MTTRRVLVLACLWSVASFANGSAQSQTNATPPPPPATAQSGADLRAADYSLQIFQIRDALKNPRRAKEVIASSTQLITTLTALGQPPRPEILIQAYEYRGHAHMALGEVPLAQKDYFSVLTIDPSYQLSPALKDLLKDITTANFEIINATFEEVRKYTLGQISLSMTPDGKVDIGGRSYDLNGQRRTITLVAGEYTVTVTRPGYETLSRNLRIEQGKEAEPVDLVLERLVSTLTIVSTPPGAEVLLDGETRGRTARADGSNAPPAITDLQLASETKTVVEGAPASAPMRIGDLNPTRHTLVLRVPCYQDLPADFSIARESERKAETVLPGDITRELKLVPATAKLRVQVTEPGSTLFFDGATRPVSAEPLTVCAGAHWVEIRGALGRFIDRHEWKTGEERTLTGTLRGAFALVSMPSDSAATAPQTALDNLKDARVLVYTPYDRELADATKEPGGTPDFWTSGAAASSISEEGKLERWSKLSQRLQAQGLAAISATAEPATIVLSLLGPNSSTASNIKINTADPASSRAALESLNAAPVRFWRPSLEAVVVDVEGVTGAMIARVKEGGVADKAGLKGGDTVTSLDTVAVTSATDLLNKIASRNAGASVTVHVKSLGATDARPVPMTIAMVPDGDPSSRVPNLTLVDLHAAVQKSAAGSIERAAAQLNLGIVHFSLGNLDEAKRAFDAVTTLSDGPGVSAGTLAYWKGLCLERLGNPQEAHAQFEKAAASPLARLSVDGPLVSPLAKLKLAK